MKTNAVCILVACALFTVGSMQAQDEFDFFTSFEFTDLSGSFTLGEPPNTVTFTGGEAKTIGSPWDYGDEMFRTGDHSWMVGPGDTGTIAFETPASDVQLFFRDETAAEQSVLTVFGPGDTVIATFDGTTDFQEVEIRDSTITTITLQNNGTTGHSVIDDFSFTAATVTEDELEVVDRFFFPFLGDGRDVSLLILFRTSMFFVNVGADAFLSIEFRDRSGEPLVLNVPPLGMDSLFEDIPLGTGQSLRLETASADPFLKVGYAIVTVKREIGSEPAQVDGNGDIGATALFTRSNIDDNFFETLVVTEAGVPASRQITDFTVFLDSRGSRDTGLAIVNPPEENGAPAQDQTYIVTVWDPDFATTIAGPIEVNLAAGEALGQFIFEIFADAGAPDEVVETLRETVGVVTVHGTGVAVTLRQDDSGEPFPDQVPTFTTFPVIPGAAESNSGSQQ